MLAAVALTFAAVAVPVGEASHKKRVVMPFGLDERHVPIIAGYELAPRPLGCDVGTPLPTTVLFEENFDDGVSALTKTFDTSFRHDRVLGNLFHVTAYNGDGTDLIHSEPNVFYWGYERVVGGEIRGDFNVGTTAGNAQFPAITIPALPATTFVAWNEKFEVEALFGYDHMWLELLDPSNGETYVLCSSDADSRPDKSSTSQTIASCSPYRVGICPTGVQGHGGTDLNIDLAVLPVEDLDPTAPHWHSRTWQIPPDFAGKTVNLRFTFDSADPVSNHFMGWMIDDVVVYTGAVLPQPYVYVPVPPTPELPS